MADAHQLSPEVLVAMICASRLHKDLTPTTPLLPRNSFQGVLDALATLCVSQPGAQAFSLGMQIDQPNAEIIITVAGKEPVEQATVDFIRRVWRLLQQLAKSTQASKKAILIAELVKLVYGYSAAVNMQRTKKWWDPADQGGLLGFMRSFRKIKGRLPPGLDGQFELMVMFLGSVAERLRVRNPDWQLTVMFMDNGTELAELLLDLPGWCEKLALSIGGKLCAAYINIYVCMYVLDITAMLTHSAGKLAPPFPLRRAIQKLTALHRYLRVLLFFASTSRLRRFFSLSLSIKRIPSSTPAGTISLPRSAHAWKHLLRQIRKTDDFCFSISIIKALTSCPPAAPHCIHSPCTLMTYYAATRNDPGYIPALRCIGMSHSPCTPCCMWLAAFNSREAQGPCFSIRDGCGRWFFPWTPPGGEEDKVLVEQMAEEYIGRLRRRVIADARV